MRKELRTNKDGSSYYTFVYYNSFDGKRYRLGKEYVKGRFGKDITEEGEADQILAILSKEVDSLSNEMQKRNGLKKEDYHMGFLMQTYSDYQKKAAPNSYRNNLHYIRYYVFPFFLEEKKCSNLEEWTYHYDDFKDWLENSAYKLQNPDELIAFGSKNHCIKSLNTFMRLMLRKHYINNFITCPPFPDYRLKTRSIDDVIEIDEMEKVYSYLRSQRQDLTALFFRLLYFTGFRFSEAKGLSLADIFNGELEHEVLSRKMQEFDIEYFGYLVIDSQPKSKYAIRSKIGKILRKPLKGEKTISERTARVVPVIDEVLWKALAKRYNAILKSYKKKIWGSDPKDYVLFEQINTVDTRNVIKAFNELGLSYRSWHCHRHSRATYLIGRTGDYLLTRMWLGHKSNKMLEKYNHLYQAISRESKLKGEEGLKPIDLS